MKAWLRSVFVVSSLEQKGIILLIILILAVLCMNIRVIHNLSHPVAEKDSSLIKDLQAFERDLAAADEDLPYPAPVVTTESCVPCETFPFDPNTASAGDLRRLGLNDHLIKTLLRYRLHGGKFYKKEDLKKIYGMDSSWYALMEPYIYIRDQRTSTVYNKAEDPYKAVFLPADINSADSVALIKIRGIGPVLSCRILKYRKLLGGFYDTEQLKEVYGLPDSTIFEIEKRYYADTAVIIRINLNKASEKDLARHPYIGKYAARGIVRYRSAVQFIRTVEELEINGLISPEHMKKLKKYLDI